MKKILYFLVIILTIGCTGKTTGQNETDGTAIIRKTNDFEITGAGNAVNWESTEWINIPQRRERPEMYETKAKVLYSETGLYFLFNCQDKKLNATITEDFADLWYEDVVEVFLWPDEDFPVYFEYELSPLNYE